jgi:hypothetical protein
VKGSCAFRNPRQGRRSLLGPGRETKAAFFSGSHFSAVARLLPAVCQPVLMWLAVNMLYVVLLRVELDEEKRL